MSNIGSATTDSIAVNVNVTTADAEGPNVAGNPVTDTEYPVGTLEYVTLNVVVAVSPLFVNVTVFVVTELFAMSPHAIVDGLDVNEATVRRFPVVGIVRSRLAA